MRFLVHRLGCTGSGQNADSGKRGWPQPHAPAREHLEAAAREILTEDFRFGGSLGPEKRGQDGFNKYMRSVRATRGDYHCVINDLIETEGGVDARMTLKGIHRAPFF